MTVDPEQVAGVLIGTFAGRDDAYPRWNGAEYTTVHAPLTPAVVVAALRSSPARPVSAFFLTPESTTHVGALDFDRVDGWDLACRIGGAMWSDGISAYAVRSDGGRAHLWLSLDAPVAGVVMRRALRAALQDEGLGEAKDIELRPKQDRIYADGYGNGLRLPTMPHKVTGKRYPLSDPTTGEALGGSLSEMLLAVDLTPAARIAALAERWEGPQPVIRVQQSIAGDGPIAHFNATVGVSAVLTREWGIPNAAPGRSLRCPAHDDRSPSLSIARDDSRAWCHSPTCEMHGPNGAGHDAYSLWQLAKARAA